MPDTFQDDVIKKLKDRNKAVNLSDLEDSEQISTVIKTLSVNENKDFSAFGAVSSGPTSGGNKDILIVPGFGGTSSETASQINFYWSAGYSTSGGTIPTNNNDGNKRTSIFNYAETGTGIPVLAIGGYDGTNHFSPTSTYGGVSGQTVAKVWIHPFSGKIDATTIDLSQNSLNTAQITFGTASTGDHSTLTQGQMAWNGTRLQVHNGTAIKSIAYTDDVSGANSIDNTSTSIGNLFFVGINTSISTSGAIIFTAGANAPYVDASNGNLNISGDIALGGGDLITANSTASLFNTNATTLNIGGGATTLSLGSSSGTATINNSTLNLSASSIQNTAATSITLGTTSSGTSSIQTPNINLGTNVTSGTVSILSSTFTANNATTLNLGASSGTATINNVTLALPNVTSITGTSNTITLFAQATTANLFGTASSSTINIGSGTLSSGTKNLNIGTGASAGVTNITIGPAASLESNTISFNGNRLQNIGTPSAANDAATKGYVDAFSAGLDLHESVRVVSVSALGGNYSQGTSAVGATITSTSFVALPAIDGVTIAGTGVIQRVLVAGGISGTFTINGSVTTPNANAANGIYYVSELGSGSTSWVLVRDTAADDNIELEGGTFVFVQEGTQYADSGWVCTNNTVGNPLDIGVTAINFTQFSGAGNITAVAPLYQDGANIGLNIKANSGIVTEVIGATTYLSLNLSASSIAGTLSIADGGTGSSSFTGGTLIASNSTASSLNSIANGSANTWLYSTGTGTTNTPSWSTATLAITYNQYDLLYASSANAISGLAAVSTSVLVTNSSGAPSWVSGATANRVLRTSGTAISFDLVNVSSDVTGTLPIANGGTNLSSVSANSVIYASSTTSLASGSTFTWTPAASGTGSTSALYIANSGVGNAVQISPSNASYTGSALAINIATPNTGAMFIDCQNAGVSKFFVDYNGNLRATTKSFDIPHPTKSGKRLVYGVLEGPEHGVYHRGTVEGKGLITVNLPEYWNKLVGDNYSVQLTPWGNYSVSIVEKFDSHFTIQLIGNVISRKIKNIKVDFIVHGSRIDAPLQVEQ